MSDYKGLTVRIGGDTTDLQAALRAANSAARTTQSELRKINSALKIDPSSLSNMETKLSLVSNRAEDVATKLARLKQAQRELGGTGLEVGRLDVDGNAITSVEQLANATENVQLQFQMAKDDLNNLNAELERTYTVANQSAREVKGIGKSFDLRDAGDDAQKFEKAIQGVANSTEAGKAAFEAYKSTVDGANHGSIDSAIDLLQSMGAISDETADRLRELRAVWSETSGLYNDYHAAAQFEEMGAGIAENEAQLKSLSSTMASMQAPTALQTSFAEASAKAEVLDRSTEELKADLKSVNEALKLDPGNVELVGRKEQDVARITANLQQKTELYKKVLGSLDADKVKEMREQFEGTEASVRKAEQEVAKYDKAIKTVEGRLSSAMQDAHTAAGNDDATEVEKALDAANKYSNGLEKLKAKKEEASKALDTEKDVKALNDADRASRDATVGVEEYANAKEKASKTRLADTFSGLYNIGLAMSTTVTPALVGIGRSALDSADSVDSAYRDMRKTVDGTEQQFEDLRQGAIDFSETHFTSADQLLEIESIGGELGIATDNLQTFAETVSNLDIATNLDTEDAATGLGQLVNIMSDMDEDDMPAFSDAIVRLGNNGASTETQIMDIAKRIGSMGSIVGFTTPQVLAWASSIASTGQEAESAGTAISKTMSDIETAVAEGGDKLQGFAQVAGESADDFANQWKSSPSDAMEAFIKGLKNIEENGGSADATLENLGITGVRQKQAIEGLIQTIGGLDDNLQMSQDAWDGISDQWGNAGDAAHEADAKAQGFSGSIQRLKNVAKNFGATLGNAMLPFLQRLTDTLAALDTAFQAMPPEMQTAVAAIGGLAAAAGPVLFVVGRIGNGIGELSGPIMKLAGVAGEAGAAMSTAEKAAAVGFLGLKTLGIGLAIAGVVTIISALVDEAEEARKHQERLEKATRTLRDTFDDQATSLENASESYEELKDASEDALDSVGETNDKIAQSFDDISLDDLKLKDAISTIEDLTGKTDLSAYEQEQLGEAVKTYNDITGDSVEITDAATGKLSESTDELKKNADAWEYTAEMNALASAAQEYYQEKIEATMQLQKAQSDLDDANRRKTEAQSGLDALLDKHGGNANDYFSWSQEDRDAYQEFTNALQQSAQDASDAQQAVDNYSQAVDTLNESEDQAANASAILKSIGDKLGDDWQDKLQAAGYSVDDFTTAIIQAGISSDDFTRIGNDKLLKMLSDAGGDVDTFAQSLKDLEDNAHGIAGTFRDEWNLGDYFSNLNIDVDMFAEMLSEAGVRSTTVADLGAENFKRLSDSCGHDVNVIIAKLQQLDAMGLDTKYLNVSDDGTITTVSGQVIDLDNMTIDGKHFTVTDDHTIETEDGKVIDLKESIDSVPSSKSTTFSVDTKKAMSAVDRFKANLETIRHNMSINIRPDAAGGLLNASHVRKHAAGYIAASPTMVSPYDMVGEAGAEAIIPLTNRQYVNPFADTVAERLMDRMGGVGGSTAYNVFIDGARLNDDDAIDSRIDQFVSDMIRFGVMARG